MFVKLFSDILSSSIWSADNETRIVWVTLLAMASRDGLVRASSCGIAHQARVPEDRTEAILTALSEPDQRSRTMEHEGRRIERVDGGYLVLNYSKYRDMKDEDHRRKMDADRAKRYRDRHANNVTKRDVTLPSLPHTHTHTQASEADSKKNSASDANASSAARECDSGKPKKPAKPKKESDPRLKPLLDHCHDAYLARHGIKPRGCAGFAKALQELLSTKSPEEVQELWSRYLKEGAKFYRAHQWSKFLDWIAEQAARHDGIPDPPNWQEGLFKHPEAHNE